MNAQTAFAAAAFISLSLTACTSKPSETIGTDTPDASVTVDEPSVGYVRITWRQEIDVRCTTPETFDNEGADSAVIEVWGPTENGRWRADMTAPSGETEVVIADVAEDGQRARRSKRSRLSAMSSA